MTESLWSDAFEPVAIEEAFWGDGGHIHLERRLILTDQLPPSALVTSIRCVVVEGDSVLVLSDKDRVRHVMPGGRIEPGETWEDTIIREVKEETGLDIELGKQLGVLASIHLTPCPDGYPYPYPEFLQVIYYAITHDPATLHIDDEWVDQGKFMLVEEALHLELEPIQQAVIRLLTRNA